MTTPTAIERAENPIRWLADSYEATQRLRIAIGNRISAAEREVDQAPVTRGVAKLYADLRAGERALVQDMEVTLATHPAWPWLSRVKGIGPTLATKMFAHIDIDRAPTVSALWRFAGLGVIDGKRERLVKGERAHFNCRLKTVLYLVAGSFLKSGSPYRATYDTAREQYRKRNDGLPKEEQWTEGHIHMAALRKMSKLFLSHLWEVWRDAVGLPVRPSYVEEYLGHTSIVDPWRMVEPEKAKRVRTKKVG